MFAFDDGSTFSVGRYDGWVKLNTWSRRSPERSTKLILSIGGIGTRTKSPTRSAWCGLARPLLLSRFRGLCVSHEAGEAPMQRLLETKESTKDAARKSQHFPAAYGKVLFLTPDGNRLVGE